MGILGLTVVGQSIIGLPTSTNKICHYPNHCHLHLQLPQLKSTSGSNSFRVKNQKNRSFCIVRASTEGTSMSSTIEKLGVKIEKNPPESRLSELGVRQWPKYEKFSLVFSSIISYFFHVFYCYGNPLLVSCC